MNIKNLLLIIVLVLFKINVYSQGKFEPGYIVTSEIETVNGYINLSKLINNPNVLEFRTDQTADMKFYNPLEIKFISISGRSFKGGIFSFVNSGKPDAVVLKDTLFIEVLISGVINLYSAGRAEPETQFYIQKGKSPLIGLVNIKQPAESGQSKDKSGLKQFQLILLANMADLKNMEALVPDVVYTRKSVSQVISYYNNKKGMTLGKARRNYVFSFIGGGKYIKYNFSEHAGDYLSEDQELVLTDTDPTCIAPLFGIGLSTKRFGSQQKFSLYHSLILTHSKYTYSFTGQIREEYYEVFYDSFNGYTISYSLQPRYHFKVAGRRIKPFVEAGLSVNLFSIGDRESYIDEYFYNDITHVVTLKFQPFINLMAGAGVDYKRTSFGLGFDFYPYKALSMKFGFKL
jgi:hypothetical protein